jgi:hypothetical protein
LSKHFLNLLLSLREGGLPSPFGGRAGMRERMVEKLLIGNKIARLSAKSRARVPLVIGYLM